MPQVTNSRLGIFLSKLHLSLGNVISELNFSLLLQAHKLNEIRDYFGKCSFTLFVMGYLTPILEFTTVTKPTQSFICCCSFWSVLITSEFTWVIMYGYTFHLYYNILLTKSLLDRDVMSFHLKFLNIQFLNLTVTVLQLRSLTRFLRFIRVAVYNTYFWLVI